MAMFGLMSGYGDAFWWAMTRARHGAEPMMMVWCRDLTFIFFRVPVPCALMEPHDAGLQREVRVVSSVQQRRRRLKVHEAREGDESVPRPEEACAHWADGHPLSERG